MAAQKMRRPASLPDYESPPINEVVIGVQFQHVSITAAHMGLFWKGMRTQYPKAQEHPPLEPKIETFEHPRFSAPRIEFSLGIPSPRLWLTSRDGSELLQIQADRFIYNWRHLPDGRPYPHFEALQRRFSAAFRRWALFLEAEGMPIGLTQWEVSYINHIPITAEKLSFQTVLTFWGGELDDALGAPAEAGRIESHHVLKDAEGPWARMYIVAGTALKPDSSAVITLELTIRGPADGAPKTAGLASKQRMARTLIVTAFDKMTTPAMHRIWRKKA